MVLLNLKSNISQKQLTVEQWGTSVSLLRTSFSLCQCDRCWCVWCMVCRWRSVLHRCSSRYSGVHPSAVQFVESGWFCGSVQWILGYVGSPDALLPGEKNSGVISLWTHPLKTDRNISNPLKVLTVCFWITWGFPHQSAADYSYTNVHFWSWEIQNKSRGIINEALHFFFSSAAPSLWCALGGDEMLLLEFTGWHLPHGTKHTPRFMVSRLFSISGAEQISG